MNKEKTRQKIRELKDSGENQILGGADDRSKPAEIADLLEGMKKINSALLLSWKLAQCKDHTDEDKRIHSNNSAALERYFTWGKNYARQSRDDAWLYPDK